MTPRLSILLGYLRHLRGNWLKKKKIKKKIINFLEDVLNNLIKYYKIIYNNIIIILDNIFSKYIYKCYY